MRYKTVEVKAMGHVVGTIWMPATECWKEVRERFTRDEQPFTHTYENLEDIVNRLENDGDFRSCKFHGVLIIKRIAGSGIVHERQLNINDGYVGRDCEDE